MSEPNDPMAAVRQYIDAFNRGDVDAMAAACADPMQILDGMAPHVWQGPTDCSVVSVSPGVTHRQGQCLSAQRRQGSKNAW